MAKYRKFRLMNGNNNYYDLTEHSNKVFANEPSGLGYSRTISVLRLGDEILQPYSQINLDTISFELLFYDSTLSEKYQKYMDFVNFLSYKPLYLLYQRPNSFTWYRRRIEVMSLDKTEVELDGMLHCDIQIQTLSFWEDDEKQVLTVTNQIDESSKVYPITYPFVYGATSLTNIPLVSIGLLEAPLEITIDGTVTNPQYILYDHNDVIYGRGRFIGTFDKVYINSKESEESIVLTRGGLILSNPLGYQDLTVGSPDEVYVTFLKLKTGQSKLRFNVDSGFDGSVTISWRNRYVSV